jgi:vacuolar-type H+-ATPase subunit C/Vma6
VREQVANLGSDFLFPKLHGRWAQAWAGAALLRLVQAGSSDAIGRLLAPLGIEVTQRPDVQRQLLRRHIAELSAVRRLADPGTARFYGAFLDRHFYDDLKTLLHYRYFPEQEVDIAVLLVAAPELPHLDAAALLGARNAPEFLSRLPEHPCRAALLPLLVEVEGSHDLLAADGHLDRVFYAALLGATAGLPAGPRTRARRLVQTEIDTTNLVMVLRNLLLYRLPAAAMCRRCLPGGQLLDPPLLEALIARPDRGSLIAALPPPYRSLLEPFVAAELYVSENALWDRLYGLAQADFSDYDHPAASLVAFAFLKRFETLNIGRVCEGVHFGLSTASILGMMIGAGHV